MRRQFTPTSTLGVALGAVSLIVAGCGAAVHGGAAAVPLKSTVQGVAIYGPLARPVRWTRTRWSPAGTHFAFAVDPRQGIAEVGSTNPLRGEQVALGLGRSVVALTAHDAIVASWSRRHDWLYPVQGTSLGTPVPWTGATDCWQQWVETAQGPAIVTGGYRSGTLALAWANGHTLALAGSQVCVAPSGRVGAVVGGGTATLRWFTPWAISRCPRCTSPVRPRRRFACGSLMRCLPACWPRCTSHDCICLRQRAA